jgi:hypothetical protein
MSISFPHHTGCFFRLPRRPVLRYSSTSAQCVPKWRNWQTRQIQGLVWATTWGFKSPLRHHYHASSHHHCRSGDLNRRGALTSRKKRATHGSPSAPSPAAIAGAMEGRPHSRTKCAPWGTPQRIARGARLRRANLPFGTSKHKGWRVLTLRPFFFLLLMWDAFGTSNFLRPPISRR